MNIQTDTKVYCLIGNPVTKSLSPYIHNYSFDKNDINAVYLSFNVDNLKETINAMKTLDIKGFNVTIPYKEQITDYLDDIDEYAEKIGAVNTVLNLNGKLIGYNTDGLGFLESLKEKKIDIGNKTILLLGAGGASRAISMTILDRGIKRLDIYNRNIERAQKLKDDLKRNYPLVDLGVIEKENIKNCYDIVINTTPVGMFPNENDTPTRSSIFDKETIIYDIIYKPNPTKFLIESEKQNKKTIDGLDMLIYQALYSELIWNNKKINIKKIKNNIKKRIL